MAFASITYTSASGTTFALTNDDGNAIEYLRQEDISVTVNGTLQTITTDYTFNAAGTSIVLNTSVSNATVVLTRTTSIEDATVSFTAGSTLTAADLNNSDRQNRFALQEFSDTYGGLTTGDEDLSALAGFIGGSEAWVSDDEHAATTAGIDARIDTRLTDDVVAGDGVTVTDDSPAAGQITIGLDADIAELRNMQAGAAAQLALLTSDELAILDGATVTTDELNRVDATSSIQTQLDDKQPLDAELTELATMADTTAAALADLTEAEVQILDGATVSTNELNQLNGNTLTNTFNSTETDEFPSSSAINTHVVGLMNALGGFVAIDDDQSFPEANPDPEDNAGTVVSITNAGGLVIDANGTSTTGRTITTDTEVTITGFPDVMDSTTVQDGLGLQVQTTTTLNEYTYHKLIAREEDIIQLSDDINDFNNRYRPARATDYTTDNDAGDLYFNTTDNVLRVFDGTNFINGVASDASDVTNTPAGDIAATNVQDAIDELDDEKVPRTALTGSAELPVGTTAERDADGGTPANLRGYIRFNTTDNSFEGHNGTTWGSIGGGATGGGGDAVFYENGQTVNNDYTITANNNAMSAGPITVDAGATVTIPAGSVWVIV